MATVEQLKAEISEAEAEIARLTPALTAASAEYKAAQAELDAFYNKPGKLSFGAYSSAKKAAAENPGNAQLQQAAAEAQATWNAQQSEYLPLLQKRDQTFDATVAAKKPIVDAEDRAAQADLAIAKIDPSQASEDARAALQEQQGTPASQPSEGVRASTSAGESVNPDGTTETQTTTDSSTVSDLNPRRVTSVEISNGQTTRYYSDGSSETDTADGQTLLDDGSGIPVVKQDLGEDPTNNNAGQPDYSNNGAQVPGVQVFDDGSTLQTFDDGSTLATGTDGSVTSSPSDDVPSGRVSSRTLEPKGASAKAEWKEAKDLRAILRVPPSYLTSYTDSARVLKDFGGIVFPYTPTISFEHQANYSGVNPLHSNYTQYFYKNSSVGGINVTAKFTVQNENDGVVLLGVIHLLRALTRMKFGPDKDSGAPPPVCRFQAYGDFMLQNVPVTVASFRHELPDSVDYIAVGKTNKTFGPNLVPIISTITLTLNPTWSRSEMMAAGVDDWLKGSQRAKGYL